MRLPKPEERLPILLVIPVVTILTAVLLIPSVWSFYLSFQNYQLGYSPKFVGLNNYFEILSDPDFLAAILRNLVFVALEIVLELFLGLGIALLLSRRFRFQRVWVALIIAPFAVSPVVSVIAWKTLLSPDFGFVSWMLSLVGISTAYWLMQPITSLLTIITISAWRESPFITLILYAAITTIPVERTEAALVDGASKIQRFRYITLPSIKSAVIIALIFRTIFAFRTFDVIWILTQGGPLGATTILSIFLYNQTFRYLMIGAGATVGVIMLFFTFIISAYYLRALYKQTMERGRK